MVLNQVCKIEHIFHVTCLVVSDSASKVSWHSALNRDPYQPNPMWQIPTKPDHAIDFRIKWHTFVTGAGTISMEVVSKLAWYLHFSRIHIQTFIVITYNLSRDKQLKFSGLNERIQDIQKIWHIRYISNCIDTHMVSMKLSNMQSYLIPYDKKTAFKHCINCMIWQSIQF